MAQFHSNDDSVVRRQVRPALAKIILIALAVGVLLAILSPPRPSLRPDQFRITAISHDSVNDADGGTLWITVGGKSDHPNMISVRGDGFSLSDLTRADTHRDTESRCLLRITPNYVDGHLQTVITLETKSVTENRSFLGLFQEQVAITGSTSTTEDDKRFHWAVESGVYPKGFPIALGDFDGKPVTLVVSDGTSKQL